MRVRVYLLPEHVEAGALNDASAVVIDALRATTTIAWALHAGAASVRPVMEVEETLGHRRRENLCVLGGERHGIRIEGFDLGNSPDEYTAASVGGREVVLTTTNGTRAVLMCRSAKVLLTGSLANLDATSAYLVALGLDVSLVCAGTDGGASIEDLLTAGAIADRLGGVELDDLAMAAQRLWSSPAARELFTLGLGGRNLAGRQLAHDIGLCLRENTAPVVCRYDDAHGVIVADRPPLQT